MGFTKWLFKNGFGSIGSTSKTWTKIYVDTLISNDNNIEKKDRIFHFIMSYTIANRKVREYNPTEPTLLIEKCEGCLAMLMWYLICEIPTNVKAILKDSKAFDISNEVVYQSVMEIAPHNILFTPSQFRIKALEYLDYRDNVAKVLEVNNSIQNTKFRTATTDKLTTEIEFFHDNTFADAKIRFKGLCQTNSLEDYIIWTIELNSNKYVYAHLCNDKSFKTNINKNAKRLSGKIQIPGIDY